MKNDTLQIGIWIVRSLEVSEGTQPRQIVWIDGAGRYHFKWGRFPRSPQEQRMGEDFAPVGGEAPTKARPAKKENQEKGIEQPSIQVRTYR